MQNKHTHTHTHTHARTHEPTATTTRIEKKKRHAIKSQSMVRLPCSFLCLFVFFVRLGSDSNEATLWKRFEKERERESRECGWHKIRDNDKTSVRSHWTKNRLPVLLAVSFSSVIFLCSFFQDRFLRLFDSFFSLLGSSFFFHRCLSSFTVSSRVSFESMMKIWFWGFTCLSNQFLLVSLDLGEF